MLQSLFLGWKIGSCTSYCNNAKVCNVISIHAWRGFGRGLIVEVYCWAKKDKHDIMTS